MPQMDFTVDVSVDVEMTDFEDEELIDELRKRGYFVEDPNGGHYRLLGEAIKLKKMKAVRRIMQDEIYKRTGMIV